MQPGSFSLTPPTATEIEAEDDQRRAELAALLSVGSQPAQEPPQPISTTERSKNPLRPASFSEIVGQERAVAMMQKVTAASKLRAEPLDHVLLVGAAGTGKTTFSTVIASELGVNCYQMAAPVPLDMLVALREVMKPGDVLLIDEIHMQAIQERRGKESSSQPEIFLQLLEDNVLVTPSGVVEFPPITVIGATTDPGRLPDPFLDRFPLQPRLEEYSEQDMGVMAIWNAERLGLRITTEAALMFARASRGTPRQLNNYCKGAALLTDTLIDEDIAEEVLYDLNQVTSDGLTRDMAEMLRFLYRRGRREKANGEVVYQASIATIATALGLSRDQKAVQLRVEPTLIQRGYVQAGHGGRSLTEAGIERAKELVE